MTSLHFNGLGWPWVQNRAPSIWGPQGNCSPRDSRPRFPWWVPNPQKPWSMGCHRSLSPLSNLQVLVAVPSANGTRIASRHANWCLTLVGGAAVWHTSVGGCWSEPGVVWLLCRKTLRKPQLRCWLPLEDMLPTSRCFSFYQGSVCGTYHCRKSQTNHPELPGIQHTYWKPPLRIGLQRLNFIQGGPKNQV